MAAPQYLPGPFSPPNPSAIRGPPEPHPQHPNGHPPAQHRGNLQETFFQGAKEIWTMLGAASEKLGQNVEALDSYHQALRYDKSCIPALRGIATILRNEDKYPEAVDYIRQMLNANGSDGESWSSLGHCYLMMDELQQAYSAYQSALYNLRDPKEPKLWYGIGILYDRYGSLDHAEEAFSQVMRMAPTFDKANEIYFRLGIIYKQQSKFEESLQCFKYIVNTPPTPLNQTDIWFQIGHVYEQQKKYEDAKTAYMEVLTRDGKHAKVLQQLGWLHHQQSNDYQSQENAIEYLEQSVSSDQTDAQSWYLLGRCYMSQHKFPKAYEAYQQAVYRDGRNPTFWCSIGVLYYQINQYRDALDAYSRAIRLNPNISEVWYDLGTLYESCNNQTTDALDAYARAAELDPSNHAIKARLELLRNGGGNNGPNGAAPMPQDVPPQAYQPTGAGGPQQGPWGPQPQHQGQNPPPPPPPLIPRDWSRNADSRAAPPPPQPPLAYQQQQPSHGPPQPSQTHPGGHYDSREPQRYGVQVPPQPRRTSPKSHAYASHDHYRHDERRPLSPSPRTRPSVADTSRAPSTAQTGQHQHLQPPHQQTPSRITNPNYGGQHVGPATPSAGPAPPVQRHHQHLYSRTQTPPAGSRPPPAHESRPRSPRSHYPPPQGYSYPAQPEGESSIARGAPPPMSAMTAAEAAARDRDRENGILSKRPREYESREDPRGQEPKKNGTEETKARLEETFPKRFSSPSSVIHQDRERLERERDPSRASPSHVASPSTQRRADEAYRPSAVAHQPAPLSTVLHQERDDTRPSLPSLSAAGLNGIDTRPTKQEEPVLVQDAQADPDPQKMEVDGETKDPEPSVQKPEEPATRKMDIDENYDDDSAEESKQASAAAEPAIESKTSQPSTEDTHAVPETNGVQPKPATEVAVG